MSYLEKFGIVLLVAIILVVLFIIGVWWWACFVAAGIILTHYGFGSDGFIFVQVVLWIVILALTGALGRIGYSVATR